MSYIDEYQDKTDRLKAAEGAAKHLEAAIDELKISFYEMSEIIDVQREALTAMADSLLKDLMRLEDKAKAENAAEKKAEEREYRKSQ